MRHQRTLAAGTVGQDGSGLARFLLAQGYEFQGIARRANGFFSGCIEHVLERLNLHFDDMTESMTLPSTLQKVRPRESTT